MAKNNMPVLYQNIMDSLPSDLSRKAFLWATDHFPMDHHCYKAEAFAREVYELNLFNRYMIHLRQMVTLRDGGKLLDEEQEADLLGFYLKRHANYRTGGNKSPNYFQEVTS